MRGGALKNLVSVEGQTKTGVNDLNEPVFSWAEVYSAFADVTARRGIEQFNQETGQRYSETVTRFRFRYSDVDGINETMRLVFEGKTYNIKSILPDHQRREECVVDAAAQS